MFHIRTTTVHSLLLAAYLSAMSVLLLAAQSPIVQHRDASPKGVMSPSIAPIYPPVARAAHIAGKVVLKFIVTAKGDVANISVINGPPMLRQAAIAAVQQWKYRPALLDGIPTECDMSTAVNFEMPTQESSHAGPI
jgi:TonB family protein